MLKMLVIPPICALKSPCSGSCYCLPKPAEPKPMIKSLCLFGNSSTGKTSLVRRFLDPKSFHSPSRPTIGGEIHQVTFQDTSGGHVTAFLTDTSGSPIYRSVVAKLCPGLHLVLLVFDLMDRESFLSLHVWAQLARKHPSLRAMVLCGTKLDLATSGSSRVMREEAEDMAHRLGCEEYFELSARTGQNFDLLRQFVVKLSTA